MPLLGADPVDFLTPGWAAAGVVTVLGTILSFVLRWLLQTHIPAKDTQLREILDRHASEREADRNARHEQAAVFQRTLNEIILDNHKVQEETYKEHIKDAEKDRDAFLQRQMRIEDAIARQTQEWKEAMREHTEALKQAMSHICQWRDPDGAARRRGPGSRGNEP